MTKTGVRRSARLNTAVGTEEHTKSRYPESQMITVCKADNPGTVVVKRLTAHSYDLRIGDERFILKSPQEADRP